MHTDRSLRNRGFTLVEVMVSTAVFAIAAMGLVALHKVSMDALDIGQDRTTAANLAEYTMTWLQNEAAAFSQNSVQTNFPLLDRGVTNQGTWQLLDPGVPQLRFDEYFGTSAEAHHSSGIDTARFCVAYRIDRYLDGTSTNTSTQYVPTLYQATVLVTWPRSRNFITGWKNCAERLTALDEYHTLALTRIVTRDFADQL